MTKDQEKLGSKLLQIVCTHYNVREELVTAKQRGKDSVSIPRSMVMALAFSVLGFTTGDSGKLVNRSHGACLNAKISVQNLIATDPRAKAAWDELQERARALVPNEPDYDKAVAS